MSLHIGFLQRMPLILVATLVVFFAGQSSMHQSVPPAGTWERPVNFEFGPVSFAEAQAEAQPMSLSQPATIHAAILPSVSQAAPDTAVRAATPRWIF